MGKKYYLRDDPERAFTPSEVKKMSKARQRQIMKAWFLTHYEDPANELPYESKEGGYQFIWGGPYDADEELQDEFGEIVRLERIQELAQKLTEQSLEWSPSEYHPSRRDDEPPTGDSDYEPNLEEVLRMLEAGATPKCGDAHELALRKEIFERLDALEVAVQKATSAPPGIGHNHPPPDIEAPVTGSSEQQIGEVLQATKTIKDELATAEPDALKVGRAAHILKEFGKWLASKADKAVDAAIAVGVTLSIAWLYSNAAAIAHLIGAATAAVTDWLFTVTLPF